MHARCLHSYTQLWPHPDRLVGDLVTELIVPCLSFSRQIYHRTDHWHPTPQVQALQNASGLEVAIPSTRTSCCQFGLLPTVRQKSACPPPHRTWTSATCTPHTLPSSVNARDTEVKRFLKMFAPSSLLCHHLRHVAPFAYSKSKHRMIK